MVYDVRQRTDNELYEKNELTNAINRVIEDMNHEFLVRVLTRTFKSSDLGIVSRQLMTDRDASRRRRLDHMLDKDAVTKELMRYLEIRDAEALAVRVADVHAAAIKAFLKKLLRRRIHCLNPLPHPGG